MSEKTKTLLWKLLLENSLDKMTTFILVSRQVDLLEFLRSIESDLFKYKTAFCSKMIFTESMNT